MAQKHQQQRPKEHRQQLAEEQNDKIGVRLRGDDGNTIRNYEDKQLWPRIASIVKLHALQVAKVTVNHMCAERAGVRLGNDRS